MRTKVKGPKHWGFVHAHLSVAQSLCRMSIPETSVEPRLPFEHPRRRYCTVLRNYLEPMVWQPQARLRWKGKENGLSRGCASKFSWEEHRIKNSLNRKDNWACTGTPVMTKEGRLSPVERKDDQESRRIWKNVPKYILLNKWACVFSTTEMAKSVKSCCCFSWLHCRLWTGFLPPIHIKTQIHIGKYCHIEQNSLW